MRNTCCDQAITAGCSLTDHTPRASAATQASAYMPAAETIMRCHFDSSRQTGVTSTYANGASSMNDTPHSRTCTP